MRTAGRALVSLLLYVWLFASSAVFFLGSLALFLLVTLPFDRPGRLQHLYTCFWAQSYFYLNPFWRCRAEEARRIPWMKPAVLVTNHESVFDIIALSALYRPFKFISKSSNQWVPFIGWNMWLNRYPLVVRGDRASVGKLMESCRRWLQRDVPVLFFAEGTRSRDGRVQAFKDGAFRLAIEQGCPIIPVVVSGTGPLLPKKEFLVALRGDCRVQVLEPIDVAPFQGDVAALRDLVRARIVEAKERADGVAPGTLDGLRRVPDAPAPQTLVA